LSYKKTRMDSFIFGWIIFAIAASFYSYVYLLRVLPNTMAIELMQAQNFNTLSLNVLSSAYYLTCALMQIPAGVAIDYYGPKKLLIVAILSCIVGSFLFGSIHSYLFAYVGRILIGFGSAFAFIGVLRIATLWLPANQFAIATGFITTFGILGSIIGNISLSYIVSYYDWDEAAIVVTLIGIPIFIALLCIPNKRTSVKHSVAKYSLMRAMYGVWQVIKMPTIWLNALAGCLLYIPLSTFAASWGLPYLQTVYGLDKVTAGDTVSWLFLGWAIGAPAIGFIADRTQKYFAILVTGSILALIAILLFLNFHFSTSLSLKFALLGFGMLCTGQVLVMVIVRRLVPLKKVATAMAFTNMIIMIGGLIFQTLIGELISYSSNDMVMHHIISADKQLYTHAMYVIPMAITIALITLTINYFFLKSLSK